MMERRWERVDGGELRDWEPHGGERQILYGFVLVMINILDLRSCHEPSHRLGVTAVRGVRNRQSRQPVDPKVSHAQPP
jgi:hypothetical protein